MYAIILLLGLHFLNICFSDQNAQDNQWLLKGVIFNIFCVEISDAADAQLDSENLY